MSIVVRNAKKSDLDEIAKVHLSCFENYFSSKLGKNLLKDFYAEYLKEFPELFVVAENTEDGTLVGIAQGYVLGTTIRKDFIRKNFLRLLFRGIFLLVKFDNVAWGKVLKIFKRKAKSTVGEPTKNGEGDLLSICVLSTFRGRDVAGKLIDKFEDGLKKLDINKYYLSVFADNDRARNFYEKKGLVVNSQCGETVKYQKRLDVVE